MKEIRPEHVDVMQTLHNAGLLSRHAMKSIRGHVLSMDDADAELYLKQLIKNCSPKARRQ